MLFEQILFFIAAFFAIAGALGVVLLRNPFFSVLALVAHLLALATLFLLLHAEFLAAAQVVVYAGAVMVLYVFVVAYIGGVDEPQGGRGAVGLLGPLVAGFLLVAVTIAVLGTGLSAIDSRGPDVAAGFGSPAAIGELLLTKFLVPFEAASFLLLVGAVGAVVLARRRRGLEELEDDSPPDRPGSLKLGGQGGDGTRADPDGVTPIPAGTAEGEGDPTVTAGERT